MSSFQFLVEGIMCKYEGLEGFLSDRGNFRSGLSRTLVEVDGI